MKAIIIDGERKSSENLKTLLHDFCQPELQIRLQLSRTTASLLADLVMPKIIDKMGEAILKNQWSEAAFIDLINQTLPTYSAIGTSLKENRYK